MFSNQARKLLFLSVTVSCVALYCFFLTERSFAATYYIAANGSDANTAAQATNTCPGAQCTPWQHAPGMTGCTASCTAFTPQPGDRFILRGGDTWHTTGGGAPVGIPWEWKWSGTAVNRIYVGVSQNWFNSSVCGASWCRPMLNGDNPLSTSPVASCAFQTSNANVTNVFMHTRDGDYVDYDNLELLGMCDQRPTNFFTFDVYILSGGNFDTYTNFYMHGWTHLAGVDDSIMLWNGDTTRQPNTDHGSCVSFSLVDGQDSDVHSGETAYGSPQCWHHNVMRNIGANITQGAFNIHDNLVEYVSWSYQLSKHINAFQTADGPSLLYNNLIRHIGVDRFGVHCSTTCPVVITTAPSNGGTDYVFNNVIYDVPNANVLGLDGVNGVQQTISSSVVVNNTIYPDPTTGGSGGGVCIAVGQQSGSAVFQSVTIRNNHCITNQQGGLLTNGSNSPLTQSNNLLQTQSAASAQGYTASNNFSPVAKQSGTVGQGVALSALCPVAGVALCSDTTLGSTRKPVNRLSSWDIGAYKFTFEGPPTLRVVGVR